MPHATAKFTLPVAYHGVSAYARTADYLTRRTRVDALLSGVEICVADRPIGPIGVTVAGDISKAFSEDVWSSLNKWGDRVASDSAHYVAESVSSPSRLGWAAFAKSQARKNLQDWAQAWGDELEMSLRLDQSRFMNRQKVRKIRECLKDAIADLAAENFGKAYCEAWMRPRCVAQVWVKSHACLRDKRHAEMLARIFGVESVEVKSDSRIFNEIADLRMATSSWAAEPYEEYEALYA